MAKVWILDTQTKGTGATMVPLESVLRKPASEAAPSFNLPSPKPVPSPEDDPRRAHAFKVVNVVTREVLAEHADARATVRALQDVRSVVDVAIYVWEPADGRWRKLTFGDVRALWTYRGRTDPAGA